MRGFFERYSEHECRLGEVRNDYIGFPAQLCHPGGKFFAEAGIQLSVVTHNGIDQLHGTSAEIAEYLSDDFQLFRRAEISGVYRVEFQVKRLPVSRDPSHVAGQVSPCVAGKASGMGRKHRRRHYARFDAHRRDYRQRNGQRAFSEARNVLYCKNPWLVHDIFLFSAAIGRLNNYSVSVTGRNCQESGICPANSSG